MMHLLLVDDHAVVRTGLRDIVSVSFSTARFSEAATAREAMELVLNQEFDMVILDISLPDENGLQLLGRIRDTRPKLPVLILSMHPEEGYAKRAMQAGANGYLNKASIPEELVSAIDTIIAGANYVGGATDDAALSGDNKPPHAVLSDQEWNVLLQLAQGRKLIDIAAAMNVHPKTVSTYKSRIMKKLGLDNNAQLMRYALEFGLAE